MSQHRTQWHAHSSFVHAPKNLQPWLTNNGSLTRRLKTMSDAFSVTCLSQTEQPCLSEEFRMWHGQQRRYYPQREVLLLCDNIPVVWGYTIVLSHAVMRDWPFYQRLGTTPLGQRLFTDQTIIRGKLEYARLYEAHPYIRRLRQVLTAPIENNHYPLFARRSMFYRRQGAMLVTEVFLPAINPLIAS